MSPFAKLRRLKRGPVTPGLAAALAAGAVLHIAGLALIGVTWRMPAPPAPPSTFVRAERADSVMNDRAELLDPGPLFLPTALNHGAAPTPAVTSAERAPLAPITQPMPPVDGTPLRRTPSHPPITEAYARRSPEEQLPKGASDTFLTFARTPPAVEAFAASGARAELRDEYTGKTVASVKLILADAGEAAYPAEFFVECDAYGASAPTLRRGTGDTALDQRLADAIATAFAGRTPPKGRWLVIATP